MSAMNHVRGWVHHPDCGLLVLRVMIALVGVFHGSQKLFGAFDGPGLSGFAGYLQTLNVPAPQANALMAASAEFFGGLFVGLGLLTRIAALPFFFTMLVAGFTAHAGKFSSQAGGMEYPLTLAAILLALMLSGAGRWSLDRVIFGTRPKLGPQN